jgi:hypothetical protein
LFHPNKWIPLLLESLHMKLRVVWSMLSQTLWGTNFDAYLLS